MSEEDMISTFLKTLVPTYQLMQLIASTSNFVDVINKATHVQLAIRVGLVTEVATVPPSTNRAVTRKATVTHPERNTVQTIKVPLPV
jgi:cephalosporin-C deacetylase-like acetyl esterase